MMRTVLLALSARPAIGHAMSRRGLACAPSLKRNLAR